MKGFIKKYKKVFIVISIILCVLIVFLIGKFCIDILLAEKVQEEEVEFNSESYVGIADSEEELEAIKTQQPDTKTSPIYIIYKGEEKKYDIVHQEEMSVKRIISSIAKIIGYSIGSNKIEIGEVNDIKIDFTKNAAPFDVSVHLETSQRKYDMQNQVDIARCVFDSLKKTLKANFGEDKEIYYSVDGKDIEIPGMQKIKKNQPY